MVARALSPKETGIGNLTYMIDRASNAVRAARHLPDNDPDQIERDIAALVRARELIDLYGDPN